MASIQDFLFRIMADSDQFKQEMKEDALAAEELKKAASGDAELNVDADTSEAKLKINELKGKLVEPEQIKIVADAAKAEAELEVFKAILDSIPDKKTVKIDVEQKTITPVNASPQSPGGTAAKGLSIMGAATMTILPALAPLLAVATAGAMGLVSALGGAMTGLIGLSVVATSNLKGVTEAVKGGTAEINKLSGSEKQAALELQSFGGFWQSYSASFKEPVMQGFISALRMAQSMLNSVKPAINGAAQAMIILMNNANQALSSPFWKSFFSYLGGEAKTGLIQLGQIAGNVLKTIAALMMDFQPLSNGVMNGLVKMTAAWANWAANLSKTDGFKEFMAYVKTNGPLVVDTMSQLASLAVKLLAAMAPVGQVVLQVVNAIAKFGNQIMTTNPWIGTFVISLIAGVGAINLLTIPINGAIGMFKNFEGTAKNVSGVFSKLKTSISGLSFAPAIQGAGALAATLKGNLFSALTTVRTAMINLAIGSIQGIANLPRIIGTGVVGAFGMLKNAVLGIPAAMNAMNMAFIASGVRLQLFGKQILAAFTWTNIVSKVQAAAVAIRAAMTFMMGPWGILIAAVIGGVAFIITHWDVIRKWVDEHFGKGMPNTLKSLQETFSKIWNSIVSNLMAAWNYISPTIISGIQEVKKWWNEIWPELERVFSFIWKAMLVVLSPIIATIGLMITSALGFWKGAWSNAWQAIVSVLKFVWDAIVGVVSIAWHLISGIIQVGLDVLTGNWSGALQHLKSIFSNVWNDIKSTFGNLINDALDFGKNFVMMIANGITGAVGAVENAVSSVAGKIKSFLGFASPTKEGPASKSDTWAPNLMKMLKKGVEDNIPDLHAVLNTAFQPPETMKFKNNVQTMLTGVTNGGQSTNKYNQPIPAPQPIAQGHTITQQFIFNSPQAPAPSEVARKAKQASQQLAMEWGLT